MHALAENSVYITLLGRADDVLNVAGHRLGTAEVESALVSHLAVAPTRLPIRGSTNGPTGALPFRPVPFAYALLTAQGEAEGMNHYRDHRLAYHEAGHVIAGYVLELGFGPTTIEPDGDDLGSATVENPHDIWRCGVPPQKKHVDDYIVVLFAGRAAEELAFRGPPQVDDGSDLASVEAIIKDSPVWLSDNIEEYQDYLRRSARALLREHWHKVRKIADQLLVRRTLQYEGRGGGETLDNHQRSQPAPGVPRHRVRR
jgi:hypothetical protein